MQKESTVPAGVPVGQGAGLSETSSEGNAISGVAGVCLIAGAILATLFNVLFPRADDPTDTVAVLTLMAENEALRQVSFLGVTAGLWVVTAGIAGIYWSLSTGPSATWARYGFYGLIIGAAIFTASTGLGMVATGAATEWVAAGSDTASAEYAIASALNAADDGVWFLSIVSYWAALGLIGIGMLKGDGFPRWSGWTLLALGFGNSALAGVPLAYGGPSQGLILMFAILAEMTSIWALIMGIWILRRSR